MELFWYLLKDISQWSLIETVVKGTWSETVRISAPIIFHLSWHDELDLLYHHGCYNQPWCKIQSFHHGFVFSTVVKYATYLYIREILSHFSTLQSSLSKQNPNISSPVSLKKTVTSLSLVSLIWKHQTYPSNLYSSKYFFVVSNLRKWLLYSFFFIIVYVTNSVYILLFMF